MHCDVIKQPSLPSHHPQACGEHLQAVRQAGSSDMWNSPSSPSDPALPWSAQDFPITFNKTGQMKVTTHTI